MDLYLNETWMIAFHHVPDNVRRDAVAMVAALPIATVH